MKLNRIVPWVMMNPIKFYDDIISDVISGDIALWAYEHDNWTIFHPISTKLGMVDGIWVQTNPIEKRLFIYFVFQQLHCRGVASPSAALVWFNLHVLNFSFLFTSIDLVCYLNPHYIGRFHAMPFYGWWYRIRTWFVSTWASQRQVPEKADPNVQRVSKSRWSVRRRRATVQHNADYEAPHPARRCHRCTGQHGYEQYCNRQTAHSEPVLFTDQQNGFNYHVGQYGYPKISWLHEQWSNWTGCITYSNS